MKECNPPRHRGAGPSWMGSELLRDPSQAGQGQHVPGRDIRKGKGHWKMIVHRLRGLSCHPTVCEMGAVTSRAKGAQGTVATRRPQPLKQGGDGAWLP